MGDVALTNNSPRIPAGVWLAGGLFAILSISAAITSSGFLEADACTHYLSASFGFRQPLRLVSVWDRPLFMLLYTPGAAWGGVIGARMVSLVFALLCAWCAWRIAARLGMRRPELAFVFTLAQPLLFLHSFAEMTELCFAAVIGLAFLVFLDRRWGWMACLIAVSPLGRPEGFGFVLLAAVALIAWRQWKWLAILPMGLLAWTLAGWLLWRRPDYGYGSANFLAWLPKQWPYSGTSAYESGPLLLWQTQSNGVSTSSFLMRLPMLISPLLFPFLLVGTGALARNAPTAMRSREGWGRIAVLAIPWGILAGHSLLWWRGLMASNGELRYLLVTAPMWGVMGALGWEWCAERWGIRRPMLVAGILAVLPVFANLYFRVVPLPLYEDDLLAKDVAAWYSSSDLRKEYPRLTASYIAVYLYMDYSPTDWGRTVLWGRKMVAERPPGVVLIWDEINGTKNADASMVVSLDDLRTNGWREIKTFERADRVWRAFLSPEPASPMTPQRK